MPQPRDTETHGEWMGRCMSDSESKRDFPNRDQRIAFCENRWQEHSNESADE